MVLISNDSGEMHHCIDKRLTKLCFKICTDIKYYIIMSFSIFFLLNYTQRIIDVFKTSGVLILFQYHDAIRQHKYDVIKGKLSI